MYERKNLAILIGLVLSVSLFSASLTALLLTDDYSRIQFQTIGNICYGIIENQPEAEQAVLAVIKEYKEKPAVSEDKNVVLSYGYRRTDFLDPAGKHGMIFAVIGFLTGGILFLLTLWFWRKKETERIRALTDYLEKVNTGNDGVLFQTGEDDLSKLQDEIYKTVTELRQTKDIALKAKNSFAENLYNIAHQIKTPIASISLSTQIMREEASLKHLYQIDQQLSRLTHLEEALLLLSRIDAGTLMLERKAADVFTMLMLAVDNLQELFQEARVSVKIPESGEMTVYVDMDWTMEAVMNVFKNCMEHTQPGGIIYCTYEQNPLYTQILIWDNGAGFAGEDIPHLFERFYRGKNAKSGGIGIGLALSKALIESQNGTISARNLPKGGACFEIRFYCH